MDSIDNSGDILTDKNNEEDSYEIIYDYNNTYLESSAIKIKLKNFGKKELIKDPDFSILIYNFFYPSTDQSLINIPNPLSCEVDSSHERLVCGYVSFFNKTYLAKIAIMNKDFNGLDEDKLLIKTTKMPYLKLQKKGDKIILLFLNFYDSYLSS